MLGSGFSFSRPTVHLTSSLRRSFFHDYPLSLALSTYECENKNFGNELQLLFIIKRCKGSETYDSVCSFCLFSWIIKSITTVQRTGNHITVKFLRALHATKHAERSRCDVYHTSFDSPTLFELTKRFFIFSFLATFQRLKYVNKKCYSDKSGEEVCECWVRSGKFCLCEENVSFSTRATDKRRKCWAREF